ncbi:MAG: archaellin/type IV pilin N-terminal domain-containing protein [Nanoarchaeota archaeon]
MKKGLSPVIATVLLITLVIAMSIIVFLWFKGFVVDECEKFERTCEMTCKNVLFETSYTGGKLTISNIGQIPIYNFNIRIIKEGNYESERVSKKFQSSWPSAGLHERKMFSDTLAVGNADKIVLIPVLLGKGSKTYTCEDEFGLEIPLS